MTLYPVYRTEHLELITKEKKMPATCPGLDFLFLACHNVLLFFYTLPE